MIDRILTTLWWGTMIVAVVCGMAGGLGLVAAIFDGL